MLNSLLKNYYKDYMQELMPWIFVTLLFVGVIFFISPDSHFFIILFIIINNIFNENFMKYLKKRQKLYSILPIKTNVIVHSLFIFPILVTTIIFLVIILFYFLMNTLWITESLIFPVTVVIYNANLLILSLSILCEFYFEGKHKRSIAKYVSYVIRIIGFTGMYLVINNVIGKTPWTFDLVLCSGITGIFIAICWIMTLYNYSKFNIR